MGAFLQIGDIYRLSSSADILGNADSVSTIRNYLRNFWNGGSRKPLIVYGPTGTGKSTSVRLVANEEHLNLVELNASDYRDSKSIGARALPALQTRSLFGIGNVILFDEIDELSVRHDRGASAIILSIIKEPRSPIIFIATDMWDQRITFLRNRTAPVGFKKPSQAEISGMLRKISKDMGMEISERTIVWIAKMCNGDVRSAINDLYVMEGASDDDVDIIGVRDKKSDVFTTLDRVFLSHTIAAPMRAVMNSDVDKDMLTSWIDENIPNRYYDTVSIHKAYDMLALSTSYSSRATRSGYYTFWRYMSTAMSAGVSMAKERGCITTKRYAFPSVIKALSASKTDRSSMYTIAQKLKHRLHANTRNILSDYLPLLSKIINRADKDGCNKDEVYLFFESVFDISEKEIDFIKALR